MSVPELSAASAALQAQAEADFDISDQISNAIDNIGLSDEVPVRPMGKVVYLHRHFLMGRSAMRIRLLKSTNTFSSSSEAK